MIQVINASVQGRIRYRVIGLYRSDPLKTHIETGLSGESGIIYFSVSVLTGNVLVVFNHDHNPRTIALLLKGIISEHAGGGKSEYPSAPAPAAQGRSKEDRARGAGKGLKAEIKKPAEKRLRSLIKQAEDQRIELWHLMETSRVLELIGTESKRGLSGELVKEIQRRYGPNLLPEAVPRSKLSIFLGQFNSLPVALLGAAAGISIVTGGLADAAVILGVVFINAAIGFITESQTERTIHSLKNLVRPSALVIRNWVYEEINAEEVVPGDILVLRPGSYVTADARLIEAIRLSVDESALTGESMPVVKTAKALALETKETIEKAYAAGFYQGENSEIQYIKNKIQKVEVPLADRINMVYMGTLVTGGQGIAVVVATGRFTEIGKIQILVGETRPPATPMERQLGRMGSQLALISGAVCGGVFIIGIIRGYGILHMLKTAISLAVAAVPEGLPTVATTTLAIGIKNMRRHNVLIRHLNAVETLGSVQTICLDKTGTITMNRMTVVAIHAGLRRIRVSNGVFRCEDKRGRAAKENRTPPGYEPSNPYGNDELLRMMHISVLCNESEVSVINGEYVVNGSSTENALINLAISSGIDVLWLRERHPTKKIIHRSERRNYMATFHAANGAENGKSLLVAIKGSPGEVLSLCGWYIKDGRKLQLTEDARIAIEMENEEMAGDALRVLGMAYAMIDEGWGVTDFGPEDELAGKGEMIWLGIVGMADPVRNGVKDLIGRFHKAGIDTVMITGDQGPTAYAIGKELNLSRNGQLEILDSTNLTDIDPQVLQGLAGRVNVFSRVSPAHKLQIVQALQGPGKVVAMTGDGINDGPALKAADIGIAMGHTGTDVAREVAGVVIEDDNLETMVIAISQGRTIYNNIRKSVHFLLSTNMSEIMVMFTSIMAGYGEPLNATQLLWINIMSDIAPGLALAMEQPEPDILSQPPRDPHERIIKGSDFKRILFESTAISAGSLGAYGYGIMRYGMGPAASTMAFTSLISGQLLHAISCRSERHSIFDKTALPPNRYLNTALGGSFALLGLAMVVPGLRSLLRITPIGIVDGFVAGGCAVVPFLVNEATKKGVKMLPEHASAGPASVRPLKIGPGFSEPHASPGLGGEEDVGVALGGAAEGPGQAAIG